MATKTVVRRLDPAVAQTSSSNRRQDVRIVAPEGLCVRVESTGGKTPVRDVSARGFSAAFARPLPRNSRHTVALTFGELTVTGEARVAYCLRHREAGWISGFEFFPSPRESKWTLEDLVDYVATSLISFSGPGGRAEA